MSTTIDQRVVEMRFDNAKFERNVHETMSTLDKFKQKLNLTGASKGLENIDSASKKVDMSHLGNAIETVHTKFSALEVMGVTALVNITNSAINAGKRMVSALTIDPIRTGLSEYETQINSVQTILANTQSKGSTLEDVNKALEELNTYADQTIYNFTEMTRNIGTFTAAGVNLDTSVSAIKGIANLAAVSGSTSQQASTAMYQLSQALATGTVKLQDWNSVVNAGMGGQVFQDALKRTATVMGTNVDALIEKYGSFRESLTQGEWLTTDVLTETLNQFTMAADEGTKQWEEYKKSLKEKGYTEDQAIEILKMANTATDAATKVKTFTQLWDVLKETAQSGWSQTWKLIIGDFEEAKSFFTPLSDFLTGIINNISNARNTLIKGALTISEPFAKLSERIEKVTGATDAMTKVTKDYGDIVNKVLDGEFGIGQERWNKLAEAGYDWAKVQNLVNERLGDSTRHTEQMTESQDDLNESQAVTIKQLSDMNEEQLRTLGFEGDEIKALNDLKEHAERTGIPIEELIKDMDQLSGRSLLINSFKNAGKGLVTIFTSLRDAWRDAFPPMQSEQLYNIIAALHKFSTHLVVGDETAKKLTRTLKGVFAIIDIVTTILGGGFKIAFKFLTQLLSYFNTDILSVTANIGDAIVEFRNWMDSVLDFTSILDVMVPAIKSAVDAIKSWFDSILEIPKVQEFIERFKNAFLKLKNIDFKSIGINIIEGFKNGIGEGVSRIVTAIINLGKTILNTLAEVLGIHSPSREAYEMAKYFVLGFVNGLIDFVSMIINVVKDFGSKIINALSSSLQNESGNGILDVFRSLADKIKSIFSNINWGQVIALGTIIGFMKIGADIAKAFKTLASPLEALNGMFESIGGLFNSLSKGVKRVSKSISAKFNTEAIRNIAISIGILVASIVVLTRLDIDKAWQAVDILWALVGIMTVLLIVVKGLSILSSKFGTQQINFGLIGAGLLGIAGSLLLVAFTAKILGSMNADQYTQAFDGLSKMLLGILAILAVLAGYSIITKGADKSIGKLGSLLIKLSIAILLMVGVIKLIGALSPDELSKGAKVILGFVGIITVLGYISRIAGHGVNGLGGMMIKLSISMMLLVGVIKLISGLSPMELVKGGSVILYFVGIIALLAMISNLGGVAIKGLGGTLTGMAIAMTLMVGVVKLIGSLSITEMAKGGVAILYFVGIIALLALIVKMVGPTVPKLAGTILAMSLAIGVMAGVAILLSLIDVNSLAKGIIAVGMLGVILSGMIYATKDAKKCKGNIYAMAVAIGVMTASLVILSFIDISKLAAAAVALGGVMLAFAAIAKASSKMKKVIGNLIVMTVAVGVMAGIIYLLSGIPVERALSSSGALSMLLLSLSASMLIIGKAGRISPMAYLTIGIMTLVIGALGGLLYLLKDLPVESTMSTAQSLSLLLLSLSGACVILGVVGLMGASAYIGIGALVTLILAVGVLITAIGALATKFPELEEFLNKGIPILEKIGYAIGSFFGNIIGGFAEGVTSTLPAIGENLTNFMNNAKGFIDGTKNVDDKAIAGISNLAKMIIAISAADLINGITSFINAELSVDTFKTRMESIGDGIKAFSDKVSGNIDADDVTAAATAGSLLAEMNKSLAYIGAIEKFTGTKSLENFGTQLEAFGTAIVTFSDAVSEGEGINNEAVEAAANAGLIMAELQKTIDGSGGIIQKIAGEKNLGTFGEQLVDYGEALVDFSDAISVNGSVNEEAVKAAANMGTIMSTLQSSLEASGGVIQMFSGEKNLGTFGEQLVAYGEALVDFSDTISVTGNINIAAISSAAIAGQIMSNLQNNLTTMGGVVEWFTGTQNLSTFGTQLVAYGKAIRSFSEEVSGRINQPAVQAAANAGTIMAEMQKAIPEDNWFDGKVSLSDFGKQMKSFGENIAKYSEKVKDVDATAVSSSITSALRIVNLVKNLQSLDTSVIENFKIKKLGEAIKGYNDEVAEINTSAISSSITSMGRLISMIKSMNGIDASGIGTFKSAVSSLSEINFDSLTSSFGDSVSKLSKVGSDMVSAISKGISSKSSTLSNSGADIVKKLISGIKSQKSSILNTITKLMSDILNKIESKKSEFRSSGIEVMNKFISGMNSQKSILSSVMTSSISNAIVSIRSNYSSFYSAGSYLVTGFANGISDNAFRARAQAAAMATAARNAAESALGIKSPSRVFYKIGDYTVQGFTNALYDNANASYNAGSEMAESARKGFSKAISKISDAINNNVDTQPTIRPVLDLSDISYGAEAINGLFSMTPSVGVMSNLRSINSMMNESQNGTNEVVSAINDLKKTLGNLSINNTSVGNITYDDGSNISDAVKSLVRAAKVERRR